MIVWPLIRRICQASVCFWKKLKPTLNNALSSTSGANQRAVANVHGSGSSMLASHGE